MITRRLFAMFSAVLLTSAVFASSLGWQQRQRAAKFHAADTVPQLVRSYVDSLRTVRSQIDSLGGIAQNEGANLDGRYYRLFVPLTFYHNVIGHVFSLSSTDVDLQDDALAHIYMQRPDLVGSTQSQLDLVGPVINPQPEKISPDADLVEKVMPKHEGDNFDAPIDIYVEKPNFWKFSGDYSLQLFQNYVSDNWYKGGESNYSMLGTVTLQANYNNKQRFRWDNKLELRLGLQNSHGDTLHTVRASEDLIRYTSKVGLQATKKWYYTLQFIASTQFMRGLKSNDPTLYSDFLSPLYINPSLGMDYTVNGLKGKLIGSVHLAPIAYNLTYVKDASLASRFGIEDGKHTKDDFGSEVTVDLTWQIMKDIRWKTRLYCYTTYKRMLMEWENTITFVFNKYISSNIFVYPRFDDGAARNDKHGYWQLKEFVSLGFSYGF